MKLITRLLWPLLAVMKWMLLLAIGYFVASYAVTFAAFNVTLVLFANGVIVPEWAQRFFYLAFLFGGASVLMLTVCCLNAGIGACLRGFRKMSKAA
jgi:hypothetical protein